MATKHCLAFLALLTTPLVAQEYAPKIQRATKAARQALEKFRYPKDLEVSLVAAEPMLANPVAFCFDAKGRMYVAETFRLHKGVTDNRNHQNWIDEELACRTVQDRVRMYERKFKKEIHTWKSEHERIRMLEDTDGDGVMDKSVVFADGFKELPDGIGAGLLAYEGRLWFTCIPKVWLLEDVDGDGKAEKRKVLHDGYGVHTSLLGHDLHGLRIGPDGRLYFSIGDRGFHVVTPEKTLSMPDEGAVFRCNLDGTGLEVVHRGLRNPQELAFDKFGNLFTGDNNSDGGDKARWVYVVEGGDSGWHIGYQSIPDRGPWNREKLWHPHHRGQAAYIVPPITNLINGPSGLTYDPGIGLPARYRDRFFLCEFRGSSSISGVVALKVAPKGAGFELTDVEELFWRVLPTDVEFGHDGGLYITDWVEGWNQPLRGRVYRLGAPGSRKDAAVLESARLLREGMQGRAIADLDALCGHADQRVRQEAQFALVRRKERARLLAIATARERSLLARLHAIWGLGQLGRAGAAVSDTLVELLADPDHEVRSQAAKVLGECRAKSATKALIERLEDRSSRVRFFAAVSLGQIGDDAAREPLLEMLRANDGRDAYLRHAGVMGLVGMNETALLDAVHDESAAVRLAVVVALRKRESASVRRFLDDAAPAVVLEAARAIHDVPIQAGMADLAAMLPRLTRGSEHLVRRAINANFRIGTVECLDRLVSFATGRGASAMRADAVAALRACKKPSGRDRVVNLWRPVEPSGRLANPPKSLQRQLARLLGDDAPDVVMATAQMVRDYAIRSQDDVLRRFVRDESRSSALRVLALETLEAFAVKDLEKLTRAAARASDAKVREAAIPILARIDPAAAVPMLEAILSAKDKLVGERQAAVKSLGELRVAAADQALLRLLQQLEGGSLRKGIQLEVIEACAAHPSDAVKTQLAAWRDARFQRAAGDMAKTHTESLHGGDKNRGYDVFWDRDDATSCKKCHSIEGRGGNAGPDLRDVGTRLTREEILASLLHPSRMIAKGFGTYVFTLDDDSVVAGMILEEGEDELVLLDAQEKEVRVARARIKQRSDPVSSMPPMAGLLDKRQLRDLVQYLATRKAKPEKKAEGHGGTEKAPSPSAFVPRGRWRAWLDSPGGSLPFVLTFSGTAKDLSATIHNGRERIPVPTVKLEDQTVTLGIDYYDSRIAAELVADGRLRGTWTKQRGPGKTVRMTFHAARGDAVRFSLPLPDVGKGVAGRWRVQFARDAHPAVGVFEHGEFGTVSGTFLTTLGDYRYLAGSRSDDALHLSCFDGAHAFLFKARLQEDGTLKGDFWSSNTWHETWTAVRDANAKLPDAWSLTKVDASQLGRLRFPDLDGTPRSLDDAAFAGKARVVVVFGSWCPNCKDETAYLAELDRKYRKRGLSILGLAFEHRRPTKDNAAILHRYAKHQGIDYPILLAGLSDKKKASQALPLLDRVRSYPTTIFLRRDGSVRAVHTGFTGPGTGVEHEKLRRRFEGLIEELLRAP